MKRLAIAAIFLLFIGAIPTLMAQRAKIEFKAEVVELGDLQEGEMVEHLFTFTNTGDAPLQILDLQPT